jgi:hypothetical protein
VKRLWLFVVAAAACSGGEKPVAVSLVRTVVATVASPAIAIGGQTQASATLLDANGTVVTDHLPVWTSQSPTIASVSTSGLVTGVAAGAATIRATSGAAAGDVQVTVTNPVAASIVFNRDTATVTIPNGSVQILATVRDAAGTFIQNPTLFWQSASPLIASVSFTGLITGVAVGTTIVRASIDGQTATLTVTVKAMPSASAATITSIAPSALLRPGASYVVTGTNFAASAANNIVLVDGVAATVTAATTTQLGITLPTAGFNCDPTHSVFLQINANGQIGGGPATIQTANARTLAVGYSVVISTQSEVRCNELALSGGKYLLSIYNATRATVNSNATASTSLTVRGAIATAAVGSSSAIAPPPAPAAVRAPAFVSNVPRIGTPAFDIAERMRISREQDVAHARLLEFNTNLLRREGPTLKANLTAARALNRSRGLLAPGARSDAIAAQVATVGAITSVKIPNLDAGTVCSNNIPINVRPVYVGPRAIIVEATVSVFAGKTTLQGQMNAYFTQLGQEFDTVMWPLLTTNFGNPLAMDAQLSNTGKVVMVFSPRINQLQAGGVLGFVVSCDFQPTAQAPSSNLGEYFYAVVPTSTAPAYSNLETRDSWLRVMRATVIHEVKHITSFAEHLSRKPDFYEEVSWEEGMARNAEELYARTFYGTAQKGNVTYQQSLFCDIRYTSASLPQCLNRPLLMLRHFDNLYSYATNSEVLTPLGRAFSSDPTFYGTAWSVERWANDQFGTSEAQFLKDFTTSSVTGPQNIEARTGRPWEESMGEWSLAMYLGRRAGFTSVNNARIVFPGYNLTDMYAGMCADLGPCTNTSNPQQLYPSAIPYAPRLALFGNFSTTIPSLVGGGVSYVEISGTQTAKQLIEIRAFTGGDPASTVRLAIVRLQ